MNIQKQVCSLEQAKRLKELGIVQTSFHHWLIGEPILDYLDGEPYMISRVACFAPPPDEWGVAYSAYTTTELGVMLPPHFPTFVHDGGNHSHCKNERVDTFPLNGGDTEYDTTPAHELNKELIPISTGNTEAQARAAMLIHLLENNLTTAEEVNKRLLE